MRERGAGVYLHKTKLLCPKLMVGSVRDGHTYMGDARSKTNPLLNYTATGKVRGAGANTLG